MQGSCKIYRLKGILIGFWKTVLYCGFVIYAGNFRVKRTYSIKTQNFVEAYDIYCVWYITQPGTYWQKGFIKCDSLTISFIINVQRLHGKEKLYVDVTLMKTACDSDMFVNQWMSFSMWSSNLINKFLFFPSVNNETQWIQLHWNYYFYLEWCHVCFSAWIVLVLWNRLGK